MIRHDSEVRSFQAKARAQVIWQFEQAFGYPPNLTSPRTFSEKVAWRKLFDNRSLICGFNDKRYVRRLAIARGFGRFLVDILATVERGSSALPRLGPCVMKATHGSGWVEILERVDPADEVLRARMVAWLQAVYGCECYEPGYWGIAPAVTFDECITHADGRLADDVKFYAFDGEVACFHINANRFSDGLGQEFFDPDGRRIDVWNRYPPAAGVNPADRDIASMARIARDLSRGVDHVRVDFLATRDRFVLNELTVYPSSGLWPFHPTTFDAWLGEHWRLPSGLGIEAA